jgi:hypothetical protein
VPSSVLRASQIQARRIRRSFWWLSGEVAESIKEYADGLFIGLRGCGKCALKFCLGHLEEGLRGRSLHDDSHSFNKSNDLMAKI